MTLMLPESQDSVWTSCSYLCKWLRITSICLNLPWTKQDHLEPHQTLPDAWSLAKTPLHKHCAMVGLTATPQAADGRSASLMALVDGTCLPGIIPKYPMNPMKKIFRGERSRIVNRLQSSIKNDVIIGVSYYPKKRLNIKYRSKSLRFPDFPVAFGD